MNGLGRALWRVQDTPSRPCDTERCVRFNPVDTNIEQPSKMQVEDEEKRALTRSSEDRAVGIET